MKCKLCGRDLYFSSYVNGLVLVNCNKCGYCEPVKIEELDDDTLKELTKTLIDEAFMWLREARKCDKYADEYNDYFEWTLEDLKIAVRELLGRLESRLKNV